MVQGNPREMAIGRGRFWGIVFSKKLPLLPKEPLINVCSTSRLLQKLSATLYIMDLRFMHVRDFIQYQWLFYLVLMLSLYFAVLALYRITIHPLTSFPEPKVAAMTEFYEFYFDYFRSGSYTFHIEKMHKKYGIKSFLEDETVRREELQDFN